MSWNVSRDVHKDHRQSSMSLSQASISGMAYAIQIDLEFLNSILPRDVFSRIEQWLVLGHLQFSHTGLEGAFTEDDYSHARFAITACSQIKRIVSHT